MRSNIIRLPIIDFSEVKPGTSEWDSVKSQVKQALEEYGSFEALFNKVPLELREMMFGAIEDIFELPLQAKVEFSSKKPFRGYGGLLSKAPLCESMSIEDALIQKKAESFTSLLWPEGRPSFCTTIQSFSKRLSELEQLIRKMVLESLGVEKYYDETTDSTCYILRVMKYKEPQTSDMKLMLNPHTDKCMVTILCQNQVNGLEVQSKDGQWISVNPSPDSFTVMIGDSFHAWTNGRLHAPRHRVMMTGDKMRYSTGLFSTPKAGHMVKSPEELVDEEHPLLFKPYEYIELLKFYSTEEGRKAESTLKAFCGV